jgi:pentapeptide MXKDX repeat protein
MKKLIIATAALTLMCGSAFAQSTGPAAQGDNMNKPGMHNGTMEKGSMKKGSMNKTTTGMSGGMKNDRNMKANPDATGEGTVGPGSSSMKK